MKYTKISIFSMLCAGALLSLADIAIGNKNISKVSAAKKLLMLKILSQQKVIWLLVLMAQVGQLIVISK